MVPMGLPSAPLSFPPPLPLHGTMDKTRTIRHGSVSTPSLWNTVVCECVYSLSQVDRSSHIFSTPISALTTWEAIKRPVQCPLHQGPQSQSPSTSMETYIGVCLVQSSTRHPGHPEPCHREGEEEGVYSAALFPCFTDSCSSLSPG